MVDIAIYHQTGFWLMMIGLFFILIGWVSVFFSHRLGWSFLVLGTILLIAGVIWLAVDAPV